MPRYLLTIEKLEKSTNSHINSIKEKAWFVSIQDNLQDKVTELDYKRNNILFNGEGKNHPKKELILPGSIVPSYKFTDSACVLEKLEVSNAVLNALIMRDNLDITEQKIIDLAQAEEDLRELLEKNHFSVDGKNARELILNEVAKILEEQPFDEIDFSALTLMLQRLCSKTISQAEISTYKNHLQDKQFSKILECALGSLKSESVIDASDSFIMAAPKKSFDKVFTQWISLSRLNFNAENSHLISDLMLKIFQASTNPEKFVSAAYHAVIQELDKAVVDGKVNKNEWNKFRKVLIDFADDIGVVFYLTKTKTKIALKTIDADYYNKELINQLCADINSIKTDAANDNSLFVMTTLALESKDSLQLIYNDLSGKNLDLVVDLVRQIKAAIRAPEVFDSEIYFSHIKELAESFANNKKIWLEAEKKLSDFALRIAIADLRDANSKNPLYKDERGTAPYFSPQEVEQLYQMMASLPAELAPLAVNIVQEITRVIINAKNTDQPSSLTFTASYLEDIEKLGKVLSESNSKDWQQTKKALIGFAVMAGVIALTTAVILFPPVAAVIGIVAIATKIAVAVMGATAALSMVAIPTAVSVPVYYSFWKNDQARDDLNDELTAFKEKIKQENKAKVDGVTGASAINTGTTNLGASRLPDTKKNTLTSSTDSLPDDLSNLSTKENEGTSGINSQDISENNSVNDNKSDTGSNLGDDPNNNQPSPFFGK